MGIFNRATFFRKKSINTNHGKDELNRVIGMPSLIFFGVGGIVGTGLFTITGMAASQHAGPAVILSFLIGAIACSFIGLCYGELAGMIPDSGSSYSYTYITMGEFMAWLVGWALVLEYSIGAAAVAVSWSQYTLSLLAGFDIHLNPFFTSSPFDTFMMNGKAVHGYANLPSMFIIIILSLLLIKGTKESIQLNNVVVFLKLFVVVTLIAFGLPYISSHNYVPFIPENTGTFGHFGISGIIQAVSIIFFAYIGFDSISSTAQETKDPAKNIPRAILVILVICALIYVVFASVIIGLVPYTKLLNDAAPVATAINQTPFLWLQPIIKGCVILGYIPVMFLLLIGQTRIFFSLSKDGLIPKFFSAVHPRFKTPYLSQIFFMLFICLIAALAPISTLAETCSIGALWAFTFVCIEVMILRRTHKDFPRKFKIPGGDIIPLLGTITCIVLMYVLSWITWTIMLGWLVIGVIIYCLYGHKHSNLHGKKPNET